MSSLGAPASLELGCLEEVVVVAERHEVLDVVALGEREGSDVVGHRDLVVHLEVEPSVSGRERSLPVAATVLACEPVALENPMAQVLRIEPL